MRPLHHTLTDAETAAIKKDGLMIIIDRETGRVLIKHPSGYVGHGFSVGQAFDDLRRA